MPQFLDPQFLISTLGLIGLIAIVFAESGILLGVMFPGDSLLFTAGLLASSEHLPFVGMLIFLPIAAILGDSFAYYTGRKLGPRIFVREESFIFKKSYVAKGEEFFMEYGNRAVIFARFIPIVRTFVPLIAGVSNMDYKKFVRANILGAIVWTESFLIAGYFIGRRFPIIKDYLLYVVVGLIVLSFLPIVYQLLKKRNSN